MPKQVRESWSPKKLREALSSEVPIRNVFVEDKGQIEVDSVVFRSELRLENVEIAGGLSFRGCRFERDIVLVGCDISGSIDFSRADVAGGFIILGGRLGPEGTGGDTRRLVLEFARFGGDVDIAGIEANGRVMARGCRVRGDFRIVAAKISGSEKTLLDLTGARIGGALEFDDKPSKPVDREHSGWVTRNDPLDPELKAHSKFTQSSKSKSVEDVVDLSRARVAVGVSVVRLRCVGSLNCTNSKFGYFAIDRARFDGDLTLSGAALGLIRMLGVKISGTLMMMVGTSRQIFIDSHFSRDKTTGTKIGAVICSGWTCTDWARFGISSVQRSDAPAMGVRGIRIINCRIADDLDFFHGVRAMRDFETFRLPPDDVKLPPDDVRLARDDLRRLDCNPYLQHLQTDDPITVSGCTIGGHLDLTNVQTTNVIDLSGCTVTNSIRFASPISARAAKAGEDEMRKALILLACAIERKELKPEYQNIMRATARRLDLRRTKAGSIDLTGLDLIGRGTQDRSVLASYVSVNREFQVALRVSPEDHRHFLEGLKEYAPHRNEAPRDVIADMYDSTLRLCLDPKVRDGAASGSKWLLGYFAQPRLQLEAAVDPISAAAWAKIPGALRLDYATIGLLRLSHESFDQGRSVARRTQSTAAKDGIKLDGATIGVLRVYRSLPGAEYQGNGFPKPVSLGGLTVRSWRLGDSADSASAVAADEGAADTDDSDGYLDLLDNDEEYRAATYLSVERSLRNRGLVEAAREVFIAGYFRAQRERPGTPDWCKWYAGEGRIRRVQWLAKLTSRNPGGTGSPALFNRLKRPKWETFETVLSLGIVAFMIGMAGVAIRWWQSSFEPQDAMRVVLGHLIGLTGVLLIAFAWFGLRQGTLRRMIDRLHWTLTDYGTSAWRLSLVILLLAVVSFFAVARDVRNFEPTAAVFLAKELDGAKEPFDVPCLAQAADSAASDAEWGLGEAFWMMLRYHIPLVSFGVMEKCQPKDKPLKIGGVDLERRGLNWIEARDWFGTMAILNFILWPLFIPFLIRKYWRDERRG